MSAGDSYLWIGGTEGIWTVASNWEDLSTGTVASVAPGITDSATITSISDPIEILGTASIGTLTIIGDAPPLNNVQILGDINVGTIDLAGNEQWLVINGGTVHAGSVDMAAGPYGQILIGSNSVFEVGTAGTAAAGVLTVDPGATISGQGFLLAGTIVDNGLITGYVNWLGAGIGTTLLGSGTVEIQDDLPVPYNDYFQTTAGELTFQLDGNVTLNLEGSVAASDTIDLLGNQDTLYISGPPVDATITGFNTTDLLQMSLFNAEGTSSSDSVNFSDGTLIATAESPQSSTSSTLYLAGDYSNDTFFVTGNGIMVAADTNAACFVSGTVIDTPNGAVSVEDLREGDLVLTVFTGQQPVRWIGHRSADCRRHPNPEQIWPVRVQVGAFGEGMPRSDLLLSPDHAVFTDGVLVPVKHLINGTSIARMPVDTVIYYHVELPSHDLLLANGLPAESYLDTGERASFANGGIVVDLYPNFALSERCETIWEAFGCAPLRLGRPSRAPVVSDLAGLVDPAWYLVSNPDVAAAGADADAHYVGWGRQEGRLPCEAISLIRSLGLVDPGTVVFTMADVVDAGLDPVAHFCELGWREARRPNPYFDTGWYRDQNGIPAGMNPLLHYVLLGEARGLAPSRHFNPVWYRERYGINTNVLALAHYLMHRRTQEFSPLPTFDVERYVRIDKQGLRPNRDAYMRALAMEPDQVEFRNAA
jgi:hypothetical protein